LKNPVLSVLEVGKTPENVPLKGQFISRLVPRRLVMAYGDGDSVVVVTATRRQDYTLKLSPRAAYALYEELGEILDSELSRYDWSHSAELIEFESSSPSRRPKPKYRTFL
jgi:hypothetical protein